MAVIDDFKSCKKNFKDINENEIKISSLNRTGLDDLLNLIETTLWNAKLQ